ncbi:MAG: DUF5615 family PIN-like protein [Balneolaceae bacterium]
MTRILLDECLPVKLAYRFQESSTDLRISTVTGHGWTGIKNGELLKRAQNEFEVFVTIDQNLSYQQDLSKYSIAIVAFKASSNRYQDLLKFVEPACDIIESAIAGRFYKISPSS